MEALKLPGHVEQNKVAESTILKITQKYYTQIN